MDQWTKDLQAQALERLEAARDLQVKIAATRATASSRDRSVTVTVGATGTLTDIVFDDTQDTPPDRLRLAVLDALGAAQTKVATLVADLARDFPGGEGIASMLRGEVPADTRARLDAELAARRAGTL